VKLGFTLPTLQVDTELPLHVARTAEATGGIDAVFAFDHLFRVSADGRERPALDGFSVLAAAAVATQRIGLGTLVARSTLRPPAVLANMFATLQRISGGRVIAGIGSGDSESRAEMDAFGLPFGDEAARVASLDASVTATIGRDYPVWIGGHSTAVRALAARTDGWNRWGGRLDEFATQARELRTQVGERAFAISWGGVVCIDETDVAAKAKAERLGVGPTTIVGGPERVAEQLRAYGDAGADWVIVGAFNASDPENVALIGERVAPLLA